MGARRWAIGAALVAAALVASLGATPGGGPPTAAAQAGATTQLVLESVDVDVTGIIEPASWTAAQGTARFAPSYGSADFSFPIPAVIPPQGAPVTLSVTATADRIFAPALGIHGDAGFVGPSTQAGAVVPAGGGTASGSATVTIVPRAASSGTKVLIYIGLQSGPRVNYRFRAESAGGCATASQVAQLLQAPVCPPPRCAGQAATVVGDDGVPGPIFGTPGRDVIVGTPGGDLILARGGDDLICGRGGGDRISGNAGADTVNGEGGDDRIFGGDDASRDRLGGQSGADTIVGGPGNDLLVGGTGDDTLRATTGVDVVEGGPGGDDAEGGPGDDDIFGGPGDDLLVGNDGEDNVRGGGGSDKILGRADRDLLFGDAGRDFLHGGFGDDLLDAGRSDEGDDLTGGGGIDRCDGAVLRTGCER